MKINKIWVMMVVLATVLFTGNIEYKSEILSEANVSGTIYLYKKTKEMDDTNISDLIRKSRIILNAHDTNVELESNKIQDVTVSDLDNHTYTFIYESYRLSTGPDICDEIMVLVKENKVVSTLNLYSALSHLPLGLFSYPNNAPDLNIVMDAINHKKNSKFKVRYDKKGFLKHITIPDNYSEHYIRIVDYQNVNKNYVLDANVEKLKQFNKNYKKWKKQNVPFYSIEFQQTEEDNTTREGYNVIAYRIIVKNHKVVKAIDMRNPYEQKEIPLNSSLITMDKLWELVEDGLKSSKCQLSVRYVESVFYPNIYGYPHTIIKECEGGTVKMIEVSVTLLNEDLQPIIVVYR